MHRLFLTFSVDKLRQCVDRIENCLNRLTFEQIWWRADETNNSIGNLALHLSGNVRQWIICSIGGEVDKRQRDLEFSARDNVDAAELRSRLRQTVEEAVAVIESVTPERLEQTISVQGYDKTVLEAIYHVVEHFTLHTGQIMFITKMLRKEDLGFYRHIGQTAHQEKTP